MKKTIASLLMVSAVQFAIAQSVGIGTNTPNSSAQLEVTSISKGLLIPRMTTLQRTAIGSPANGLMVYDTNLSAFYFYNGNSGSWNAVNSGGSGGNNWATTGNNIYNSNTGNVGIGLTAGMKEKFSLKGNLFITHRDPNDISNGGNRATINLHGDGIGGSRINFLNTDTTVGAYINYYKLSSQLKDFSLNNGTNTSQLSLNENGNVGVGKIPTEKLDVNGTIRSREDVIVDNNLTAAGKIEGAGIVSTAGLTVANASIFGSAVYGVTTAQFTGQITSNTGITINDAAGTLTLKNSTDDKGFVQLSGNDLRTGTFSTNSTGRFIVRTGGTNNLIVASDGKTGLGVDDPQAKLHINSGASTEALRITGNTNSIIRFMTGATEKSYIYAAGNDLNISTVQPGGLLRLNGELYVDKSNGRVGVGTVTPDQKLHVNGNGIVSGNLRVGSVPVPSGYKLAIEGKVICEEVRVKLASSGWPDYVFSNNYRLSPLWEVEKFIKKNKHLPNIPSADEVEKEGIAVGDMQKKMMEKIEELTLYIIELKREIDSIKKQ